MKSSTTLADVLAWCQTHHATIVYSATLVRVSIRTYPTIESDALEVAVRRLQELQQERKQGSFAARDKEQEHAR